MIKLIHIHVIEFFCNFRNFALSKSNSEWNLMLDINEQIDSKFVHSPVPITIREESCRYLALSYQHITGREPYAP